ncbi:hypothetical protein F4775DRAFT_599498 [Biscogniauxia sp. FL1348]|nr:hypothetical protein F4775DRAFT_599498 [Biscogniauxia sp. FL1348]
MFNRPLYSFITASNLSLNYIPESVLEGPIIPPPPGTTPQFDSPQNQNGLAKGVIIFSLVMTSIFALLRVHSRVILKQVKMPDLIGIAAFGFYIALVYIGFEYAKSYKWFVHTWDLRFKVFPDVNKILFVGSVLYYTIILLVKSAILLEWIYIFIPRGTRDFFFLSSCSILVLHGLFYTLLIVLTLAGCSPFAKNWNPLIPGRCYDTHVLALPISVVNLAFDVTIFCLPQKAIWRLQMAPKRKMGVSALFAVGILACVAAAFRVPISIEFYVSQDPVYTYSKLSAASFLETTCGFICLCGPMVPKAIEQLGLPEAISSLRPGVGILVRKLMSSENSHGSFLSRVIRKPHKSTTSRNTDKYKKDDAVPMLAIPIKTNSQGPQPSLSQNEGEPHNFEAVVIRTTIFTTVESHGTDNVSRNQYTRQHPWVLGERSV